jgi:hypothetical protein
MRFMMEVVLAADDATYFDTIVWTGGVERCRNNSLHALEKYTELKSTLVRLR